MLRSMIVFGAASIFICACSNNGDDNNNPNPNTQLTNPPPPELESVEIEINVEASRLYGDFTLDGNPFPQIIYDSGSLYLRDKNTQDLIELAETQYQLYDATLVNGEYESIYQFFTGSSVPVNTNTVLQEDIDLSEDREMDIDVPTVSLQPTFTLDGGSFPASVYHRAAFYLQRVENNELILLGETHIANNPINIIPGEYHIIYQHLNGETVPVNKNARIQSNVSILSDIASLRINVVSDDIRTQFTHNSTAFPVNQYNYGQFFLINMDTHDEVFIGNSYDPVSIVKVVRGIYNVSYRHKQGTTVPININKIINNNFDTTSSSGSININTVTIAIDQTLNGEAFPQSQYNYGDIELYDQASDSTTRLGPSHSGIENLPVIPGTYDINYTHKQGALVPLNINGTVIADRLIDANETINLDVIAHELSSSFTLDTGSFPQSAYSYANIVLQGEQSSEDILLTPTNDQSETILVLPGDYDVFYRCIQCLEIPANTNYVINEDLTISDDLAVSANIQSVRIDISATLNGGPFPASIYNSGHIWAGTNRNDAIYLMRSYQTAEDIIVAAGNYIFYYEHFNGNQVPINHWAEIETVQIDPLPN